MRKPELQLRRLNTFKARRIVESTDLTYSEVEDFLLRKGIELQLYWVGHTFEGKASFRTKARRIKYGTELYTRNVCAFFAYKALIIDSSRKFILAV